MSYWSYYFAWVLLAYVVRQPWLLAGIVAFFLLRKVIPDPFAILRALGRSRSLRAQVEVNAANVTARRDLAVIYLDLRRPRAALRLVEQALARTGSTPPAGQHRKKTAAAALTRARTSRVNVVLRADTRRRVCRVRATPASRRRPFRARSAAARPSANSGRYLQPQVSRVWMIPPRDARAPSQPR